MKFIKLILLIFLFNSFNGNTQCNTNTSICTPGETNAFPFIPPSNNPSSCLDFTNGNNANYGYVILYITSTGPLNLLINSPTSATGFVDVAIFDITGQADPCNSLGIGTEIGCNYATNSSGCNQFGTDFPCPSSIASPMVTAGDVLMILVEDWSNSAGSFTLQLGNSPGSAQTGPGNPTITAVPTLSTSDPSIAMTAVDGGGTWSSNCGACIDPVTGVFDPAVAGSGTFQICYDLGSVPCDANDCINVTVEAPCVFTGISANQNITCPSTTYTTTGTLTFTDPPVTGTLTITDCNGNNQIINAPFISPLNYTITGQNADGLGCDVTAIFSDEPLCTNSANYTAPICPCNITNFTTTQSVCSSFDNSFTASGSISFEMPPITGTLTITVNNGTTSFDTIINAVDFISPLNYTISGIDADGSNSTIVAVFSANGGCTSALAFTAPIDCSCDADAGSSNPTMIGSGNSNFVLCWGDSFTYTSNGNYVAPTDVAIGTFNPGIGYAVYSCPPTPGIDPNSDVCFEGIIAAGTGNFVFNDINDLTTLNSYPAGTFTNNIIYYVPITMYDVNSLTYSASTPPCYDLGVAVAVQYIPEMKSIEVEDCQNGSISSTITGGLPEIDGSNYSIVPGSLMPTNASFGNTSTTYGGTITINGLTNGQDYSYHIVDANGCSVVISGNFIGVQDASFSYNTLVSCQADTDPTIIITGDPGSFGFTVNSGGPTLSINATTGIVDLSASDAGVYEITYTTDDPLCFSISTVTMTIQETPILDPILDQTVCNTFNFSDIIILGTSGSTFDWTNTNITIGLAASGTGDILSFTGTNTSSTLTTSTITITPTLGTCVGTPSQINLNVNPTPSVNAGIDQTVCEPLAVTLTATNPDGAILTWNNGITDGITFTPVVGTTTYTVTADLLGCISTDNVDVTVNPLPLINAGIDQTVCENENVTLTATNPDGAALTWSNSVIDGTAFVSPIGTTSYTITATLLTCVSTDIVDVIVNPLPVFTVTGTNPTTCGGTDGFVTISGLLNTTNYQVSYNNGTPQGPNPMISDATGIITITGLGAGNYTGFLVDALTCTTLNNTVINLVDPSAPAINAGINQTICEPLAVTLTATNPDGAILTWNNGITDGIAFTPVVGTTTYTVTADLLGCISTDNVDVTVNPLPLINAGIDQTVCENENVTLTATNPSGAALTWSNSVIDGTAFVSPIGTTSYTITATLLTCVSTDIVDVIVNPLPVFTVTGTNPTTCGGTDGFVTISGLLNTTNYQISYNNGTPQGPNAMISDATGIITITGLSAGNYTDFLIDALTCTTINNTVINLVDPSAPAINAGIDQTVCEPLAVTLTATNPDGGILTWNNGITDGIAFTPVVGTTTYTVTADLLGCISTDNVDVTVNPLPLINAGIDQTVCENENVTLTATNPDGAALTWSNSVIDGTVFVSPIGTTSYTITATLLTCVSTDIVDVTVNPLPVFTVTGINPTTCGGSNGIITISGLLNTTNYQISYNNGTPQGPNAMISDATGIIAITGLSAGNYTDFLVGALTCTTINNTVINLVDPSAPTINAGIDQTVCEPLAVTLTAINPDGAILTWNNGIADGIAFTPVIGTTTYTITAVLLNCTSTDEVDIIVNPLPLINAGIDQTVCENENVTLTATNPSGAALTWNNSVIDGTAFVSPIGTTSYTITATLLTCVSTDVVDVLVNPLGNPGYTYPVTSYCTSENDPTPTIDIIGGNFSFSSIGGGLLSINPTTGTIDLDASSPDTYSITYTTVGPCPQDSTIVINIALTPEVFSIMDQTVCHNSDFSFININGSTGVTFNWTNDNPSIGLSANGSGDIPNFEGINSTIITQTSNIIVTPSAGSCIGQSTFFNLSVTPLDNDGFNYPTAPYCLTDNNPIPTIAVGGGVFTSFTTNGTGTLDLNSATGEINLSNSIAGSYNITYTTSGVHCPQDSTLNITVDPTPTIDNVTDQTVCDGLQFVLTDFTGNANPNFDWTNNNTNIGLASSGSGDILPFISNTTGGVENAMITVTPSTANCLGLPTTFILSVNPLDNASFTYPSYNYCSDDLIAPIATLTVTGGNFSFTVVSGGPNLSINNTTGEIDLAMSNEGVYDVTYSSAGPCIQTATQTVTINLTPTINAVPNQTVCTNGQFSAVNFTGTNGILPTVYNWTNDNPTINLPSSGAGNINSFSATNTTINQIIGSIIVIPSTSECAGTPITFDLLVNPIDDASFQYDGGLTYCATGSIDPVVTITGTTGGAFSYSINTGGPNLIFDTTTGAIDLSASDVGSYYISYVTAGICNTSSTLTLVITHAPIADFTIGSSSTYCANETDPMPIYQNNGSGGIFSATPTGLVFNSYTGQVDLDASNTGTYTVTNTIDLTSQGCILVTDTDIITINQLPTAFISGSNTICPLDDLSALDIEIHFISTGPWDVTYTQNGNTMTVTNTTPYIFSPTEFGSYNLVSVIDANGCSNTANGQVMIDSFPTPSVHPLNNYYGCEGSELFIHDFGGYENDDTFNWSVIGGNNVGFGTSGSSTAVGSLTAPGIGQFTGINPQTVTVDVYPISTNGCIGDTIDFDVIINPTPIIAFEADNLEGCLPSLTTFTNQTNIGSLFEWNFGDGTIANGQVVSHSYTTAGTFDVSLTATTTEGCTATDTAFGYISIANTPIADFTLTPQITNVNNTEIEFTNESEFGDMYEWNFGDGSYLVNDLHTVHTYDAIAGQYSISLLVTNNNGACRDSIVKHLTINDILLYYVPNVFTPELDDYNQTFKPIFTSGFDVDDYHLSIFNRWGELIFESRDHELGWNGSYKANGDISTDGVYIWKINFKELSSDKRLTAQGHVTLLK